MNMSRVKGHPRRLDFPAKGTSKLGTSVAVYVPSTQSVDQKLSSGQMENRVQEVVRFLNSIFGGTTRIRGVGSWISSSGQTVSEDITIVETYTDKATYLRKDVELGKWLEQKKGEWGQESLSYEYDNKLYLI